MSIIWFFFPLDAFFLLHHPGNDKGRNSPFCIHGAEPHTFNSFSACFWYIPQTSSTVRGHPCHRVGYLVGKIIHNSLGLGNKILGDPVNFVLCVASPDSWSPSLFLLVCPPFKFRSGPSSLSSSAGWCPVLLPLLWPVSLQNCLTLEQEAEPLGDFWCNWVSFLSSLLTSSTCSLPAPQQGTQALHPAQLPQLPSTSLWGHAPGPLKSPFFGVCSLHSGSWLLTLSGDPCHFPGLHGEHILRALWLLTLQAAHMPCLEMPL